MKFWKAHGEKTAEKEKGTVEAQWVILWCEMKAMRVMNENVLEMNELVKR